MTREEAIKGFEDMKKGLYPFYPDEYFDMAIKALEQEPKTGEWIEQNDDYFDWYECSECGYGSEGEMQYSSEYDVRTNYCPCCGARMEEVKE